MKRLNVAFVGEIDHGKSTLIGRILLDTGSLSLARDKGVRTGKTKLPHLMDQLGREQDENITVNTSQAFLSFQGKKFALVDAPGHEEFLKHMLTGASISEAAVLLIDAEEGVQNETRRHALLVDLLGIKQVIAVVNKIDLLESPEKKFMEISRSVEKLASGLNFNLQAVIPASALEGTNVVEEGFPWFSGPTVLDGIVSFMSRETYEGSVRFVVQDVYTFLQEPVIAGRVEEGVIKKGDILIAEPSEEKITIKKIVDFPGLESEELSAPQTGNLIVDKPGVVKRGQVFAPGDDPPRKTREVYGRVFCLGPASLRKGEKRLFRCATQEMELEVIEINDVLDSGSLMPCETGEVLNRFELGVVKLRSTQDLILEDPHRSLSLGRFVLEDDVGPVALGMVIV